jgi:hypothetical protein
MEVVAEIQLSEEASPLELVQQLIDIMMENLSFTILELSSR